MDKNKLLAERFEKNRVHLKAIAYRMLGTLGEADDAVQEAWLRLSRSDTSDIENLGGWLTTVVRRVCLDMLRSRRSKREEPLGESPGVHVSDSVVDGKDEATIDNMSKMAPLERLGTPADIAEAVAFLAGPARWVNGQVVYTNGGVI